MQASSGNFLEAEMEEDFNDSAVRCCPGSWGGTLMSLSVLSRVN